MKKVTIEMENGGVMTGELYEDIAPITVENFEKLAKDGFYNGLTFHRIVPGFVLQGGDPLGNGYGGPGYSIKGEFSDNGFENNLKHEAGVISMARSQSYDSAGSQFFICTEETPGLDGQHAAFGKVTSGMEVVYAIEKVQTDANDKPLEDIVIESITVDEKGGDYSNVEKIEG